MLSEQLKKYIPSIPDEIAERINDIDWKTQDSTYDSLLFYRLGEDAKSQKDFSERIRKTNFAWVLLNRAHVDAPKESTVISESKWNELQKNLLDAVYPMPTMKMLAITGTNGKSTTTDLVLQLGELAGLKGLSIGTLGVRENHKTLLDFGLTSPSYIDLRKFLFKFGTGKDFCVLEASSHALVQERLYGLKFDGGGFVSFSQDHLDYHQSMDEYFKAKCLLIDLLKPTAPLFVPSEQKELLAKLSAITFKVKAAREITGQLPVFFSTRFNRNNLEVALSLVEDVLKVAVPRHFDKLIPPDGRFFIKPYKTNYIVVDFAHTPDALDNICSGIKTAFPEHQLKVLFGCGGDRDRVKRPLMAAAVAKWADEMIITSDNPRTEDPEQIIDDIVKGIPDRVFTRITNRPEAVQKSFGQLKEKEILLLAGKGHEDYILIQGVKHPYSDIQEVERFLAGKKND